MTAPLRRNHFLMWMFLAAALGFVLYISLAARRPAISRNPQLRWEEQQ
jgi:hypothetical protein